MSRNGEDQFMMKLPIFCIHNFKKALEMAMAANGMVALPLDEQLRMMGKARMGAAMEQALKVYTQQLNRELYECQGEEMMREAELAAAAAITAEGEEKTRIRSPRKKRLRQRRPLQSPWTMRQRT